MMAAMIHKAGYAVIDHFPHAVPDGLVERGNAGNDFAGGNIEDSLGALHSQRNIRDR